MKYQCLRTCYVGDRMRIAGEEYEIVGSTVISPKNFVSSEPIVDVVVEVEETNAVTTIVESTTEPTTLEPSVDTTTEPNTEEVTTTPAKEFKCPECGQICKSKGGLKTHRKTHKKK